MAIKKVKGSVRKKQSAVSTQHSANPKPTRKTKPKTIKTKRRHQTRLSPGQLALRERVLPGRRFVEFPQVKGKVIEKVELYTTGEYHSITLDLQDRTALNLRIDPGFTLNAELQEVRQGEIETIAEWPPVQSEES